MPFEQISQIRYYRFEIFSGFPLVQAIFTRNGGVSCAPWSSLNLGGTVGDDPSHVSENRHRAFQALGIDIAHAYDVWQVHSSEVVITDRPRPATQSHLKADAILTDTPGVSLFMRFADCVPIFLYDPTRRVIGLVHAGWKGTVDQIAARAVERMQSDFHSNPADILAGIGPSIGPHHYEIGPEVAAKVHKTFGQEAAQLLESSNGNPSGVKFDLWNANRLILMHAGVDQVEIAGLCTACDLENWFSHRGEHGRTGRFGAILSMCTDKG